MSETPQRVAIVVAGGSGMGAAAARKLHAAGFAVGILSSSGKGEALARELGGVGVTGSNQSVADLQKLMDAVIQRWGRIDVLVNSAGHGPKGKLLEISDEDWVKGLEVYFLNVVRATRLVAPIMQRQGGGSIINISTAWTFEPSAMFPTSAVARSGFSLNSVTPLARSQKEMSPRFSFSARCAEMTLACPGHALTITLRWLNLLSPASNSSFAMDRRVLPPP